MNINESSLEEYVNNVVKSIMEDVFDSSASAAASRANIKKATKTLGKSSPHTKALTKLHGDIKKSRHMYGISDDELDRQADAKYSDMEFSDIPAPKPTLTPMKGKAWDGYDAQFGKGDKKVNLGVIKKAAAAIKNKSKGK